MRSPKLRRLARLTAGTGLLALAGCSVLAPPFIVQPYRARPAESVRVFRAGAAKADITPPPGYPTGGHGPAGSIARGHWGRLWARAFFFQDERGQRAVLVSADLFAVPAGLRLEVARRAGIPPAALLLAATHTHQSPGNFLTTETYNQYGSAYPGFSKPLFEHLAARIAEAIGSAERNLRPATLRVHSGSAIATYADSFVRNRSPRVFALNVDRGEILKDLAVEQITDCAALKAQGENGSDWGLRGCLRIAAADQALTVLEAREPGGAAFARLVFFAAHPTVLDHGAPLDSPDFVGWAMGALERERGGVAGFFNGAEGDITPRRARRDLSEVREVGELFRRAIERVLDGGKGRDVEAPVLVKVERTNVRPDSRERFCREPDGAVRELAREPLFGAAGLGGAEDDRTILYDLGWREGVRTIASHHQGPKLEALDSKLVPFLKLTRLLAPPRSFPSELPVSRISLGTFTVGGVPVELSTAQGWRLRRLLHRPHGVLEVVGLADEYSSYAATPEEYVAQDYMGASSIWGPEEGAFFGCVLAGGSGLLREISTAEGGFVSDTWFAPGPTPGDAFGPVLAGDLRARPEEELEKVLRDADGLPEARLPWFRWSERVTRDVDDFRAALREVRVEDESGAPLSSVEDFGVLVLLMEAKKTGERDLAAVWLSPLWGPYPGRYRFVVSGPGLPGRRRSIAFPLTAAAKGDVIPDESSE